MGNENKATVEFTNGEYSIIGKINEFFDSKEISGSAEEKIIVNLEKLKGINSLGIRTWVLMLEEIAPKELIIKRLPFFFIEQILMIKAMKGHATIESLQLPFFCEECESEAMFEFQATALIQGGVPFKATCKKDGCDGELEFDEDADRIISILK